MKKDNSGIHFENYLIGQTSPYLLQHAHQPVNWHPWSKDIMEKAKQEDKMILVSIGYSTCHWCHVMAHESFDDLEVADWMNQHFICVKIDREERPDIDQVFMEAVHLLNGQGGWPLNCFATPDCRPFWGGTYFPKENWLSILDHLVNLWKDKKEDIIAQAEQIEKGIIANNQIPAQAYERIYDWAQIQKMGDAFLPNFDMENGGFGGAPKFPMPSNLSFLMRYGWITKDSSVEDFVQLSLDKIGRGGIYDHLGGGFARYTVDKAWKVPHFEKMLYDNAQLISLYSQGYSLYQKAHYAETIHQSLDFIEREMKSPEGGYYAAIDADSEGEEGLFYVWKHSDFDDLEMADQLLIKAYFGIGAYSYWEHNKNILAVELSDIEFAAKHDLDLEVWKKHKYRIQNLLLNKRAERIRPHTDTKLICSWNALLLEAFCDAAAALQNKDYLERAEKLADFMCAKMYSDLGDLQHIYAADEVEKSYGFFEDYAYFSKALFKLYKLTNKPIYLDLTEKMVQKSLLEFYDAEQKLFNFQRQEDVDLIGQKLEYMDNVMPSPNSVMGKLLFELGSLLHQEDYINYSQEMLNKVGHFMFQYPTAFGNWMHLACDMSGMFYTLALTGPTASKLSFQMQGVYQPNSLIVGSSDRVDFPLFEGPYQEGETLIHICHQHACLSAVKEAVEAWRIMKVF